MISFGGASSTSPKYEIKRQNNWGLADLAPPTNYAGVAPSPAAGSLAGTSATGSLGTGVSAAASAAGFMLDWRLRFGRGNFRFGQNGNLFR